MRVIGPVTCAKRPTRRPPAGVALDLPGTPSLRSGDTVQLQIDGLGGRRPTFGQA